MLPAWCAAAGGEQCQTGAASVSIIEHLRQQAFGLTQGLMAARRGRGIDHHQQQFTRATAARLVNQILAALRTTAQQCRQPLHRAIGARTDGTLPAAGQSTGTGNGIRPLFNARADA